MRIWAGWSQERNMATGWPGLDEREDPVSVARATFTREGSGNDRPRNDLICPSLIQSDRLGGELVEQAHYVR